MTGFRAGMLTGMIAAHQGVGLVGRFSAVGGPVVPVFPGWAPWTKTGVSRGAAATGGPPVFLRDRREVEEG